MSKIHFSRAALLTLGVVCSLAPLTLAAQDTETVRVAVYNHLYDVPSVDVYLDGESILEAQTQFAENAVLTLPVGEHDLTVTAAGDDTPLFETRTVLFEAGQHYGVLAVGPTETEAAQLELLDLVQDDDQTEPQALVVHELEGAPALDFWLNDERVISGLEFGDSDRVTIPDEGVTSYQFTEAGTTTVFENLVWSSDYSGIQVIEQGVYTWLVTGDFSGTIGEDQLFALLFYFGGPYTVIDGGAITPGTEQIIDLSAGERDYFTFDVADAATFDVTLSGNNGGQDAYLRIYDTEGVLFENDELNADDNAAGNFDAGVAGLTLEPGHYVVEAGSFSGMMPGEYMLMVVQSEE